MNTIFNEEFRNAVQLKCFRHLQTNIKRHLQSEQFPSAAIQLFINDIFGADSTNGPHHVGLVDCHDVMEFEEQLEDLEPVWEKREQELGLESGFYSWFRQCKAEDFCNGALKGLREQAGLGSPPQPYYTNSNEAMNRVIKEKTQWKKHQWPEFNERMKELVGQQQRDVEKAVLREGEYTLKPQFKELEVSEPGKWWRMNEEQRSQCLKRFNECTVEEPKSMPAGSRKGKEKQGKAPVTLTPKAEVASQMLSIPLDSIHGICKKAADLCADATAVAPMPGGRSKDRFVLAGSSVQPHAVTVKGDLYHCDSRCLHFQSLSLCSQSVMAAHLQEDLATFLQALVGKKRMPNLFRLSKHGMPRGAGKKGGKLPRRKPTKQTVTGHETAVATALPLHHHPHPSSTTSGPVPTNHQPHYSDTTPGQAPANHQPHPSGTTSGPVPLHHQPHPSGTTPGPVPLHHQPHPSSTTPGPVPLYRQPHPSGTMLPAHQLAYPSAIWTCNPSSVLPGPPKLWLPSPPTAPVYTAPFTLVFIMGQVSTCFGCRKSFMKPAPIPFNLVVRHEDHRSYTAPDGTPKQRYGNVYYHLNRSCITAKQPHFDPTKLVVSQQVMERATQAHSDYLQAAFGVTLAIPSSK